MKPVQYYDISAQLTAHHLNSTLMHHINSVNTVKKESTALKTNLQQKYLSAIRLFY